MNPFRLGVVLEQPLEVGGGFQQSLNDVLWLHQWATESGNEIIVLSRHHASIALLARRGIKAELLRVGVRDYAYLFLKYFRAFDFLQFFLRLRAPFEKRLIKQGIDVLYFTTPSRQHFLLNTLPFIFTVFDGCHRDAPEFEEVSAFGEFERREELYQSATTKAALVVTNAPELIDDLCRRYAMEPDRAICIPLSPSAYVTQSSGTEAQDAAILQKYGLQPGYLFYPAQFWSHKNHATLLAALTLLRDQGTRIKLVLCGSDRGYRNEIERLIEQNSLRDQVSIIGFVDSLELGALYRGATATVMPTYFGPTNLPPLEAWTVGTVVIYPEAFKAQVGDAAILFDYDSPRSLADAILRASSADLCATLRIAGKARLQYFVEQREIGRREFSRHIGRLKHRLRH